MAEIQSVEVYCPQWIRGRHFLEQEFCQEFLEIYPMVYVDGHFFTARGWISEGAVRKHVYDYLRIYLSQGLAMKVNTAMETLKLECRQEALPVESTRIYCANGVYNLMTESLEDITRICRYRLPVNYNPRAPKPELWLKFLSDLLEPEDIPTLQEFMGYCLIPVNYAQKMLLIIGRGGEGKSRIGILLGRILGTAMANGSLAKLESSPFSRADLEHRLVMVDDDLRMEALRSTNYIKSIITAEQPMDLERKGQQSYQGILHCRLIAFGNGNLQSLHDRSHGFFRRQIILTAKPRDPNRQDDPYLSSRLGDELEGILLWMIQGLMRLLENDMQFTISPRAKQNLRAAMSEGSNALDFMASTGYFRLDPQGELSSRALYDLYQSWCRDNMLAPLSARSFINWIHQNQSEYGLQYDTNIYDGSERRVRGFRGIRKEYFL